MDDPPPSSTPRHLKRLSLSVSSLGSPGSSGSPSPIRLTSLASPRSQSPRIQRLGTNGQTDGSPASAPPNGSGSFPLASSSTQSNPSSPTYGGSRSPGAPWSYPRASTATSPATPGAGPRGGGHSRKMSSISYSSSREVDPSPRGTANGSALGSSSSPLIASPSPSARARAEGGHSNSVGRSRMSEENGRGSLDEVLEEEEEDGQGGERTGDEGRQSSFLSIARSGVSMGAQPTLTEVNSDLLSFIAKKERKVLELREELKRHDEELKNLKKKWESIVARSLASATPPTTTSMPRPPTAAENSRRIFSRSSTLTSSPSALSSPSSPRSAVDVGLVSSPFDGPSLDANLGPTPDIEIGESVQAAKAWMGGVFGKVLEAVGGLDDAQGGAGRLIPLEEEDEPEEGAPERSSPHKTSPASPSASHRISSSASASSVDEWRAHRTSTTSVASTSTSSASSFGFGGMVRPPSDSGASEATIQAAGTPSAVEAAAEKQLPARPRTTPLSEGGHNRRRSTFDMLGSAAGSLGKRWGAISSSETFKSGRAAALNAVDTFERRLTETLGPLDAPTSPDPSASPVLASSPEIAKEPFVSNGSSSLPSGAGVFSSWKSAAPASAAAKERAGEQPREAKPKEADWDWSAFLEGPTEPVPSSKPTSGGYRRPSLTPKASSSSNNLFDDVVPTTASLGTPLSPSSPAPYKSRRTLSSSASPQQRTTSLQASVGAPVIKEEDEWGW